MTEHYDGIMQTVHISTDIGTSCEHCAEPIGGSEQLPRSIDHYINVHGYRLLHVGQESSMGDEGLYHHTVAVLGKGSDEEEVIEPTANSF